MTVSEFTEWIAFYELQRDEEKTAMMAAEAKAKARASMR